MSTLIYYVNNVFFCLFFTLAQWYPTVFLLRFMYLLLQSCVGIWLFLQFLLLSVTVHMFLWIYWCTHMYKCLLASASVKFKFSQLRTHMHSFVRRYSICFLYFLTLCSLWLYCRERLSLIHWCNRSVTASPALWWLLWDGSSGVWNLSWISSRAPVLREHQGLL